MKAFLWGRRTAHNDRRVREITASSTEGSVQEESLDTLDKQIQHRADVLKAYQNKAYAQRYIQMVERSRTVENDRKTGESALTEAVARYYFKLLAYKDEYEVARLYTNGDFYKKLNDCFDGDFKLKLHLAPPIFSKRDPHTREPIKSYFGAWMFSFMKILAKFKFLRGTLFDPFGKTKERKMERQLIQEYEQTIEELLRGLSDKNHSTATEIAKLPEYIRGFDLVKHRHMEEAKKREKELLEKFRKIQDLPL